VVCQELRDETAAPDSLDIRGAPDGRVGPLDASKGTLQIHVSDLVLLRAQSQRIPPFPSAHSSSQTAVQSIVVVGVIELKAAAFISLLLFITATTATTGIMSQLHKMPPSPLLQRSAHTVAQSMAVVRLLPPGLVAGAIVVVLLSTATITGIISQLQRTPPSPVLHSSVQTACQSLVVVSATALIF
jgi:hypothetical protein